MGETAVTVLKSDDKKQQLPAVWRRPGHMAFGLVLVRSDLNDPNRNDASATK